MSSLHQEESPFLRPSQPDIDRDAVYKRFPDPKKRAIVVLISGVGLFPMLVSGTFIPSIPQIVEDLESTGAIISLALSLTIFAGSVGMFFWSSFATFYGRRPVYLGALPLLFIGSFGAALSRTVPQLMIWRFVQALGAAPALSVGVATVGDLYSVEERGTVAGMFFSASLVGQVLSPAIGGFAVHYASWRVMQVALGVASCVVFVLIFLYFPETSHPGARGIDNVLRPSSLMLVNPLRSLLLLRSSTLTTAAVAGFLVVMTEYVLLVPMVYTIGARYGITNEALIGACFLPSGIGNVVGASLAGRLSDTIVTKRKERRRGVWYPEDRLRVPVFGALFLAPLSVIFALFVLEYVPGRIGLTLSLGCLFIEGLGVDFVGTPSATYVVDIMRHRSAESAAAFKGLRGILTSIAIAGVLPMVQTVGVAATYTLAAFTAWVGCIFLWCIVRYGDRMRAWDGVDYSTGESN